MSLTIVGGCVAPSELAPVLTEIQHEIGCSYASIYRGQDAAALLHRLGKHTQAEVYYEWTHHLEPNPANSPGHSTHEMRSDAIAYAGPSGRALAWWQCGIDVDDAHVAAFVAAAARHGWVAFRPYHTGSEYHHVNFAKLPVFFKPDYRWGSSGPMVMLFTQRLVHMGYLHRRYWHYKTKDVHGAVVKFQKDHHLTADGVVGPATWTLIKKLSAVRKRAVRKQPKTISKQGVEAIAGFEGGQSPDGLFHPYRDMVGVWTIGYGHTEGVRASSRPLTKAQALALLERDLNKKYVPAVLVAAKRYKWAPLSQVQLDALASFCYNLGVGYFTPAHDVGKALQRHDIKGAAAAILEYNKAGGAVAAGLVRRRKWEHDRFLG